MHTYHHFMSCSRWLMLVGILWLPASLLAQSGLVPDEASKMADTVTVRRGMGVFGNVLGIHGADTLALQGDLVLVKAEIVGEGTLSLCASHLQRIVAQKSSVQNLHLANSTKVMVQGDLTIKKSLVVEKGIFDSRMANLTLSDSCRLRIEKDGRLLWQETSLLVKQAKTIPQPRPTLPITWTAIWQELMSWKREQLAISIRFDYQQFIRLPQEHIPPSPPPECGHKSLLLAEHNECFA